MTDTLSAKQAAKVETNASREPAPAPLIPALDFSQRQIPAHGTMGVDFEQRVDFHRLRDYRLNRAMDRERVRKRFQRSDKGDLTSRDRGS